MSEPVNLATMLDVFETKDGQYSVKLDRGVGKNDGELVDIFNLKIKQKNGSEITLDKEHALALFHILGEILSR